MVTVPPGMDPRDWASAILSWGGVRLMSLAGVFTVGVWSDLDCREIREALQLFGSGEAPVRYLDGPGVPPRYKLRRVAGEPVPMNVLAEMERHPEDPWKIRDQLLGEMVGWYEALSWEDWCRRRNDRIFKRDTVANKVEHE